MSEFEQDSDFSIKIVSENEIDSADARHEVVIQQLERTCIEDIDFVVLQRTEYYRPEIELDWTPSPVEKGDEIVPLFEEILIPACMIDNVIAALKIMKSRIFEES